jgi:hypothetical protein
MHALNYLFRQGSEHRYAYDYETLSAVIRSAGFGLCRKREFDPTLDEPRRRVGTLYVEAHP